MIRTLLEIGIFPAIKGVLKLQGIDCGNCIKPFQPLRPEDYQKLEKAHRGSVRRGDRLIRSPRSTGRPGAAPSTAAGPAGSAFDDEFVSIGAAK